jgi:PPM family protein phosphatase
MSLAAYGATHPGRRSTNEDSLLVDPDLGLFIVADGMGGHNAGEVASDLAVNTIRHIIAGNGEPLAARLERAIRLANRRILETASRRGEYSGMGTTVSAVCVIEGRAIYSSIGDSRVYRMHGGVLAQLTQDDSWISNALATGVTMTQEEIDVHPMRHVLTEVVGVRPDLEPKVFDCELEAGDLLLICSDGLHGSIPQDTLGETLAESRSVEAIAETLVQQAIEFGATDNVTAVVVRLDRPASA